MPLGRRGPLGLANAFLASRWTLTSHLCSESQQTFTFQFHAYPSRGPSRYSIDSAVRSPRTRPTATPEAEPSAVRVPLSTLSSDDAKTGDAHGESQTHKALRYQFATLLRSMHGNLPCRKPHMCRGHGRHVTDSRYGEQQHGTAPQRNLSSEHARAHTT